MTTWRLILDADHDGAYNMAADEAIAGTYESADFTETPPTLRFYGWKEPTLSIGYFQKTGKNELVARCIDAGLPIVRRPTGGRALLHHREITYSVAGRTDDPLFPKGTQGTYCVIAQALLSGLRALGISGKVIQNDSSASPDAGPVPEACFSHPYGHEIAVDGKKLIGSAQRRWRGFFLQHGSILLAPDSLFEQFLSHEPSAEKERTHTTLEEATGRRAEDGSQFEWIHALCGGFRNELKIALKEGRLSAEEIDRIKTLEKEKYASRNWIYKR